MFNHPMLTTLDNREGYQEEYGEDRWISIGLLYVMVGIVVYTERKGDIIRIISDRKAIKAEARRYE